MWHSTKHNAATQRKSRKSISIMGQRNAHLPPCSFHNTSILCKNSMMMHHIGSSMYLPPFLDKEIILLTQKILKNYTLTPIIQCVPNLLGHTVSALGTSLCTKGLFCNFFKADEKLHVVYPLDGLKSYQVNHKVQAWGWRFKILTDFSIPFASWHHEYINLKCDSDIILFGNYKKKSQEQIPQ